MSNKIRKISLRQIIKDKVKKIKNKIQCLKLIYEIFKDFVIPLAAIAATIAIAFMTNKVYKEANNLSNEAIIMNKKNESLLYHNVEGNEMEPYTYEYKGEVLKILCKAHALKIDQGIVDEIIIIVYDGKYFSIYDQYDHDLMEKIRTNDYIIEIGTPGKEFTQVYNDIVYDYFFIYIKGGDGTERIDLAYTHINLSNGTTDKPKIENKMAILKLNDEYKKDLAYYEMLEVYKDLQEKFSELLKIDTDI